MFLPVLQPLCIGVVPLMPDPVIFSQVLWPLHISVLPLHIGIVPLMLNPQLPEASIVALRSLPLWCVVLDLQFCCGAGVFYCYLSLLRYY